MDTRLLATLTNGRELHTFLFDAKVQSLLWLCMDEPAGFSNAVAALEFDDGSAIVRSVGQTRLCAVNAQAPAGKEDVDALRIDPPTLVRLHMEGNDVLGLLVRPVPEGYGSYVMIAFSHDVAFCIGRTANCELCYASEFVSAAHARVSVRDGHFEVEDLRSGNGTYVNGRGLSAYQPRALRPGDVVQILDLTFVAGMGFMVLNQPQGMRLGNVSGARVIRRSHRELEGMSHALGKEQPAPFYPAPQLSKSVHPLTLAVDAPPARKEEDEQPILMHLGPSLFMGMASTCMVASSVSSMLGGSGALAVAPTLSMAVAMVGASLVWPLIARAYGRRRKKAEEAHRAILYVAYLDAIENALHAEVQRQTSILREVRQPVNTLLERADRRSPLLMSRTCTRDDFIELRVGVGDVALEADVSWPDQRFTLSHDAMLDRVSALATRPPKLSDVPLAFNPVRDFIAGVWGPRTLVWEFVRGLLVQICALYSYRDVKVVLIAEEREREQWRFLTSLGHLHDDSFERRLIALTPQGMAACDRLLGGELDGRLEQKVQAAGDYGTYYVVVCANSVLAKRSLVLRRLEQLRANAGFSLIFMGSSMNDLPRECTYLIDLTSDGDAFGDIGADEGNEDARGKGGRARMFERSDVLGTLQAFEPDIMVSPEEANAFAHGMARVRLDAPEGQAAMPEALDFLSLYEAGNVAHLNIGERWVQNDSSRSLMVPVGVDERGETACLNLHENAHGPHGLIAGTTGSGKSEFIITLVLSLAVNFAPDEVAFVLIDYKGGGLAGAFENGHHRLPHLAGSITNLDGNAIHRSLISLQSELRCRQDRLNRAREQTGEATMDIHKYLSLYRQGRVLEPMPHLFVVADEFAELKQQEPDFMDELVSAARIGRSLGVHLILATQKPSGVVDDQIWSNARLKIALKVSDAADSREIVRTDVAATLTRPGAYCMLVGYSESSGRGQAAYAGSPYVPTDRYEPHCERTVELLDAEGNPVASLRMQERRPERLESQANAVLTQIERVALTQGKQAKRLWLDPLDASVTLADLRRRYAEPTDGGLLCVVGEVDDPYQQRKFRWDLDLAEVGCAALYGSLASDVEGMLRCMLISLLECYDARGLWVYCVDLGSGRLVALEGFPQVGGVVLSDDSEGLRNLLHLLEAELARRRGISAAGDPERDAKEPFGPRIVVPIINLATLLELHPAMEDCLVTLMRDAPRYGIHFLITASTPSALRMRLRTNCGIEIATQLNDSADYLSLLGGLGGMSVPREPRRGLVRMGKRLFEFQGSCVALTQQAEEDVLSRMRAQACDGERWQAKRIPRMPAKVLASHMGRGPSLACLPVGYSKSGIEPVFASVTQAPTLLVLGNDGEAIARYLRGVWETLSLFGDSRYCFVDPQRVLGNTEDERVLVSQESVARLASSLLEGSLEMDVIVFTSVVRTMEALPKDVRSRFEDYITNERNGNRALMVAASESWRTRSVYEEWMRVLGAHGSGVWVGGGFFEQTSLSCARMLPEYRNPAERNDGFLALHGAVEAVRLVEKGDEAHEGQGNT